MVKLCARSCLIAFLLIGYAFASTNTDGVSGLLVTPTAEVVSEGSAVFTLSRHMSPLLPSQGLTIVRVYSATVGYLPGLEITARVNEFPEIPDLRNNVANLQDRAASAKYRFLDRNGWQAAAGLLDIGGDSQIQSSYYGVISYGGLPGWQFSAGGGSEVFEGVFGGARWTPAEYVSLLGEYDTEDFNYGIELRPLKGVTLKGGYIADHGALSASYSIPVDPRGQQTPCCPLALERRDQPYDSLCDEAVAVREALIAESFENVRVGSDGETLFIEAESRRFTEQVDALAVAAALGAVNCGPETQSLVVTPKIEDVPQLSLRANVDSLINYLNDPALTCSGIYVNQYYPGGYPPDTVFAPEANKKPGHSDLQLRIVSAVVVNQPGQPAFRTKVGLGLEEQVFLGRGTKLKARQDWPLFNDINDKTDPVNRSAYLTYLDSLSSGIFAYLQAGYFGGERYGGTGEAAYYFNNDRFKLGGRYGLIEDHSAGEADGEDAMALGELAYLVPELDWQVSALAGQFQEGDRGVRVESTRYFGPTELTFFAYDTDESEPSGGLRLFVPLPWFDDARHGGHRAGGSPYFGYQYRTDSEPLGRIIQPGDNLELARQRLRPAYVREHLSDFRRAVLLNLPGCTH